MPWTGTGCDLAFCGEAEIGIRDVYLGPGEPVIKTGVSGKYCACRCHSKTRPAPGRSVPLHAGGDAASPVYTSRGCPFNCRFCSKITGNKYREIPIAQIIEEINDILNRGFKKIVFGDDNIASNPKRLEALLTAIKPLDIRFRLNSGCTA